MEEIPDSDASPAVPLAEDQPAANPRRPRWPLTALLRAPWARMLTTTLIIVAALAYIIGSTIPGGLGNLPAHVFAPAPTRVPTATATPTATPIIPTPQPASGLLGPPPVDCPAAVSLDSITAQPDGFTTPVQMFGRSPVWVPESFFPANPVYITQGSSPDPYPGLKIVWEIGPTQHPEVTARVTDIRTAELAFWFGMGGTPRAPVFIPNTPVLDIPAVPNAYVGWEGGPTGVAITHAGCYRFDVSWNGGGWYTIFAVGGRLFTG